MFEIAETFLRSEDYDNAIKFYDRLNRLEQLNESDLSVITYKRGLLISEGQPTQLKKRIEKTL